MGDVRFGGGRPALVTPSPFWPIPDIRALAPPARADARRGSKARAHFAVMPLPCTIMPGRQHSAVATAREGFHASQHYRRARAPVVGSRADRIRGRAATG